MEKVIYIGYQPLTTRIYCDFYFETCIHNGFEVEYWDISHLYFPKVEYGNSFDFAGVKHIKSFRELKTLLSFIKIKSTIFIITNTYEYTVWRLFLMLSSFNCTLAFFGRGMYPMPEKNKSSKIRAVIFSLDFNRIITGLKNRVAIMLKKFKIVKPYDFIFRAGIEGYKTIGFANNIDLNKANIIDVNYFDYDKYLKSINGNALIDKDYCVFLDEYLPYHPDIEITRIKTVTANDYYSKLNIFFDYIEKKFNVIVIIAAHPKALKYVSNNPFGSKIIIFNKTCELVRDAKFVMTHHSTSISFPILFKKPIFFITSQSQKTKMPLFYELTLYLGKFLNCQVIHFDDFDEKENLNSTVDVEKFNDYKYKYLTSEKSENKQSSEIFIKAISQYY